MSDDPVFEAIGPCPQALGLTAEFDEVPSLEPAALFIVEADGDAVPCDPRLNSFKAQAVNGMAKHAPEVLIDIEVDLLGLPLGHHRTIPRASIPILLESPPDSEIGYII